MRSFLKKFTLIVILFISFLLICMTTYAGSVFNNLSSNVFRLHIIANSDSDSDQQLKLRVRDAIIEYMKNSNENSSSKENVISYCQNHLAELKQIAEKVIQENGYNYTVNIEIGNFYFPTKNYANISLPAGQYDALRIKIGNAEGKNWWCSLFPPLCFVDVSSGVVEDEDAETLKENLDSEDYSLITSDSEAMKFKFKIVEIINKKLEKNNILMAFKN